MSRTVKAPVRGKYCGKWCTYCYPAPRYYAIKEEQDWKDAESDLIDYDDVVQ